MTAHGCRVVTYRSVVEMEVSRDRQLTRRKVLRITRGGTVGYRGVSASTADTAPGRTGALPRRSPRTRRAGLPIAAERLFALRAGFEVIGATGDRVFDYDVDTNMNDNPDVEAVVPAPLPENWPRP